MLHVTGLKPTALDGTYWTDRLTSGDITIERLNAKIDLSAADALAAVRSQGQP